MVKIKMAMMMYASIFTAINVVMLLALLLVYVQNYREIKASFSLGLIIFAAVFLLQKVVTLYMSIFLMFDFGETVGMYMFILEILETIAFSVLLWITMR